MLQTTSLPFRSLQTRIVVFFTLLLALVQGVSFVLVGASSLRIARAQAANELAVGERVFERILQQRSRQLAQTADVLARDYGFLQAVTSGHHDTILSAIANHGMRVGARLMTLVASDRTTMADTLHPERTGTPFALARLIDDAEARGQSSALELIDGNPYQLVVVPVRAPQPIGWIVAGFGVDQEVTQELKALTTLETSFIAFDGATPRLLTTTLGQSDARQLLTVLSGTTTRPGTAFTVGADHETLLVPLGGGGTRVVATLQRPLADTLESFARLRDTLLTLAVASLLLSVIGSVLIARGVTHPIKHLAKAVRRAFDGQYVRVDGVASCDEVGDLAGGFNKMLDAIESRERKITKLAFEDSLTGLPNRALFGDRLETAIRAAKRKEAPLTVLMIDLDRFKHINDSLGHQAGDQVLCEVGRRLSSVQRESDTLARFAPPVPWADAVAGERGENTVARLGGDEFAFVLLDADAAISERVVRRIIAALKDPVLWQGHTLDINPSIGVAYYPGHGTDAITLLRAADVAMYDAKRHRRTVTVFDPKLDRYREDQLSLLGELKRAVERDELFLVFQPKVSLNGARVLAAEALLRWNHPQRGPVVPANFIPFAEQTGFISELTRWVLRAAVSQSAQWLREGCAVNIAVNLSMRDLVDRNLPTRIESLLREHGVAADLLTLEVTESGFMDDPDAALETLRALRGLGCHLAVDDFGTGYSSLAYIKRMPVDEVKIDRAFVAELTRDKDDHAIVRSVIELGHILGLKVVAEGVEDQATLELLRRWGCDIAQGYFLSKPLSATQVFDWFQQHVVHAAPSELPAAVNG